MLALGTATGLKEKKSFKCGINIYKVQRCRYLNGVWRKTSLVGSADSMEFKASFSPVSKLFPLLSAGENVIPIKKHKSGS
jgi:hypothetical protein